MKICFSGKVEAEAKAKRSKTGFTFIRLIYIFVIEIIIDMGLYENFLFVLLFVPDCNGL